MLEDAAHRVKQLFRIEHFLRRSERSIFESLQVRHVEDEALRQLELRLDHLDVLGDLILLFLTTADLSID